MHSGFDTDIGPIFMCTLEEGVSMTIKKKSLTGLRLSRFVQKITFCPADSHKHINNIEGTDGMALPCLLAEGLLFSEY